MRSADGEIAWVVEHYLLILEGNYGQGMKADTVSATTNYTFQHKGGRWQIVAMFDSYFKTDNTSDWAPLWQWLDATAWRGKKFRLEAAVRTATGGQEGAAGIWARVDKASGSVGFFDNMDGRPIRSTEWATYQVEGTIDEDALWFNFGALQDAPGTGYFDDFKLNVETEPGKWTDILLPNAGFENPNWEDGKPEGWQKTSAFWLANFQVEQSAERPFAGKYALKVTGEK